MNGTNILKCRSKFVPAFLLIKILSLSFLSAQNFKQIGVHISPTFTIPNKTNFSYTGNYFKLIPKVDFSIGVDYNFYFSKHFGIGTGIWIVQKRYGIMQYKFQEEKVLGEIESIPGHKSLELPLLFNFPIINNNKATKAIIGVSYNINWFNNYKNTGEIYCDCDTIFYAALSNYEFGKINNFQLIVGGSIELPLKRKNIEVGLTYHYGMSRYKPIEIKNIINDIDHDALIQPKLSYFNLRLVLYFINIGGFKAEALPEYSR